MSAVNLMSVRKALRSVAVTADSMPIIANRSWENRNFTPPNPGNDGDSLWVRETMIPGDENKAASDMLEANGIVQYDCFFPSGMGTEIAEQLAHDIKDVFEPGTSINHSGVDVAIDRAYCLPGRAAPNDSVWYGVPVQIRWRSYQQTNL